MLTRWMALGAAACVVGACGGKVSTSSGDHSDGTGAAVGTGGASAGSGGGNPVGGASSGGAATGGVPNPTECPANPPAADAACSFDGGDCYYVTADKGCCQETADAACVDGRWNVRETDCDCPMACPAGLVLCTGVCVDLASDREDCGACGHACAVDEACVGGSCAGPNWFACENNEDCRLAPASCCGSCGGYSVSDVVAVHRDELGAYSEAACGGATVCPACAATELPSFTARCAAGRCEVVDLTEDAITACTSDSDCVLRTQACCECGAPGEYVAIASTTSSAYADLVCVEGQGCDACLHEYPVSLRPTCDAGHCLISL